MIPITFPPQAGPRPLLPSPPALPTGGALASGQTQPHAPALTLPTLSEAFSAHPLDAGAIGFALASLRAGRRAWALARADGWLRADDDPDAPGNAPPPEDQRPEPPLPVVGGIHEIIGAELDHVDVPHHRYVKAKGGRARPARNDKGA